MTDTKSQAEAALVLAWTSGDARAAATLLARHSVILAKFLRRRRVDDAEDIAQEAILSCLESIHGFRSRSNFGSYLIGIALNRLSARRRRLKRETSIGSTVDLIGGGIDEDANSQLTRERREATLTTVVDDLPVELRTVLILAFWKNRTKAEMSVLLGVPEGTVASRIRRAKEILRRKLAEET
jgi:RNA polymerase sigma-70 factor (ECF subfamily)